jgi:hypothetical protein
MELEKENEIKYPKGKHPRSLRNLKPVKPGEIRNPTGASRRPFSNAYYAKSMEKVPKFLLDMMNMDFQKLLARKGMLGKKQKPPLLFDEGITWAAATSLRQLLTALVEGDTRAVNEVADRIEGRPTMRIEEVGKSNRIDRLIEEFRLARSANAVDEIQEDVPDEVANEENK